MIGEDFSDVHVFESVSEGDQKCEDTSEIYVYVRKNVTDLNAAAVSLKNLDSTDADGIC